MRMLQVHGHSQQKVGKKRATRCIKGPHVVTELKEESVRTWLFSCLYPLKNSIVVIKENSKTVP